MRWQPVVVAGVSVLLAAASFSPTSAEEAEDGLRGLIENEASVGDGPNAERPGAQDLLDGAPDNPFDRGEYPIEEPWLSDLTALRRAHGLDASIETMVALMSSSEAQRQIATFGVLLTPAEQDRYALRQAAIDVEQAILGELEEVEGFAGSIVDDNSDRYRLTILLRSDARAAAERAIGEHDRSNGFILDVDIEEVKYSVGDLDAMARALNKGQRDQTPEISPDRAHLQNSVDEIVATAGKQPDLAEATYGYSMLDNALLAIVPDASGKVDRTIPSSPGAPALVVRSLVSDEDHHDGHPGDTPDDQDDASCGRWWCGSPRGGHYTDLDPGGICTWAGAVRVKLTSNGAWLPMHLTAGHCGEPTQTNTYYSLAMEGASLDASDHFEIVYRRNSSTQIGSEWRNSLELAGDAWGDFALITTLGVDRSGTNLMMTSSSTTTRVTSLGTVSVGSDVCISVPHVDTPLCDEVENIGWTKTVDGKEVTQLAITRGSYEGEKGDSGGPLYRQGAPHILAGVHQGEKTNWIGQTFQLFSRATLIDDSPNLNLADVTAMNTDGRRDFVQGMYYRNLNRTPDWAGYNYWRNIVLNTCTLQKARDVAWSFMNSTEFNNRFPITTGTYTNKVKNAELRVWYAYRTYYGRNPDAAGLAYWLDTILIGQGINVSAAAATQRWLDIIWSFGQGVEFTSRVNGPTASVDGAVCG